MKRPNGVTPPPVPSAPATPVGRPVSPKRQAAPKQQAVPSPPVVPDEKQKKVSRPFVIGEARVAPPVEKKAAPPRVAAPRQSPAAPKSEKPAQKQAEPSRSRSRDGDSLARKNVRIAERRRRRYERAESRRFTERARRRRIAWLVSLGVLALVGIIVLVTAYSPIFAVRSVSIEGTSRIDAAQVEAALQPEVGRPLALVDYGAIKAQLAAFPLIQTYSTESSLPNTLIVHIVERQPVGTVAAVCSGFDLVDPAGVVVQHSDTRPDGFPLIDITASAVGTPGFLAETAVLRSLPTDLLGKVDSVSAATPDSVTLVLAGGAQKVVWGGSTDSALKARVLDKLIGTQSADSNVTYDVSSPLSPVVS